MDLALTIPSIGLSSSLKLISVWSLEESLNGRTTSQQDLVLIVVLAHSDLSCFQYRAITAKWKYKTSWRLKGESLWSCSVEELASLSWRCESGSFFVTRKNHHWHKEIAIELCTETRRSRNFCQSILLGLRLQTLGSDSPGILCLWSS